MMRPKWEAALDLYEPVYTGGNSQTSPSSLAAYLTRHPKEDDDEFARRSQRVFQINGLKMVLGSLASMLFSTDVRITSDNLKDQVDKFVGNCNLRGDNLMDFYREQVFPQAGLNGAVDIFVDLPPSDDQVTSLKQQQDQGLTDPYCYLVPPLNRVRWQINEADEYTYYQSMDKIDSEITPQFQITHQEQYQCWQLDQITTFDKSGKVIGQKKNPYNFIPAVTVIPMQSVRFYKDKIGDPLVDGLVEIQREILNTLSLISDYHASINFAQFTIIQDTETADVPTEGELQEMGTHRGMMLKGKDTKAMILTPNPDGVKAMQDYVDQLLDKMFQLSLIPIDSNNIKTHTSAGTIRSNLASLYNRLTIIARHLEKSMKQVVEMALRVQGISAADVRAANVKVEWDVNFSYEAFINSIEQLAALKAAAADIAPTAIKEYTKKVVGSELYGSGKLDQINKEIDQWKPQIAPETPITANQTDDPIRQINEAVTAGNKLEG